jgi:DNA-binding response OmpR family regulator
LIFWHKVPCDGFISKSIGYKIRFLKQGYAECRVDDNSTNLGVLTEYLEEQGFEVLSAEDGYMGLEIAQFAQPNLILLDVMMPGIDGFETCRRLKANDKTQDIPVIFMTALESTKDKVNGFKVGGVDYITKPVQQEEVLARISTHLRIQDLTQKLQQSNHDLSKANQTIMVLNEQLKDENMRMKSELQVAHRLQQMALPLESELMQIKELDIVGFMVPAEN